MPNAELMKGIEVLLSRSSLVPEARRLIELALVAQECGVMPCLDGLAARPLTVAAAMVREAEAAFHEAPEDGGDDACGEGDDGFPGGGLGGGHGEAIDEVDGIDFLGTVR
jgi:hypothetical protein